MVSGNKSGALPLTNIALTTGPATNRLLGHEGADDQEACGERYPTL
jgi:hypothetical protein